MNSSILSVLRCLAGLVVLFSASGVMGQSPVKSSLPGDPMTADCNYWRSLVDRSVEKPVTDQRIDESNSDTIIFGIRCLLTLQGNKNPARFSGVTRTDVSQTFDEATADVAALYYISYLYTGRFDHARAVALRDPQNGQFNSDRAIGLAFQAYKKWFGKVERIGLRRAREIALDPLKGAKTGWY